MNTKARMLKATVLSVSMLTILVGAAVAPALGRIRDAFPDVSALAIQMVLTLPPLVMIPVSLAAGQLSRVFSKKRLVLVGLLLYLIGGMGAALVNRITILLIFRAVIGVGAGLLAPLSLTLIADFFRGEARSKMMGYSVAVSNLGGIVMILLSGQLAESSWRLAFTPYLTAIISLVLIWFFLTDQTPETTAALTTEKFPWRVYLYAGSMFLLMVVFYLIPTKMAIFLQDNQIGNAAQSGVVIAFIPAASFFVGLFFGKLRNMFGRWMPVIGICLFAAGLLLLSGAAGLGLVYLAMALIGFGAGSLVPVINLGAANLVPPHMNGPALSIVSSSLYLGQFMSPVLFDLVPFQGADLIRPQFALGGWITAGTGLLLVGFLLYGKNTKS